MESDLDASLGKKSGKYSILYELRERKLNASEEQIAEILKQVKQRF